MSKVESLFGGPIGSREVSEAAVAVLSDLLERAKSGEIQGITAACIHSDGAASYHLGGNVGGFSVLGALDMIKAQIVEINAE